MLLLKPCSFCNLLNSAKQLLLKIKQDTDAVYCVIDPRLHRPDKIGRSGNLSFQATTIRPWGSSTMKGSQRLYP